MSFFDIKSHQNAWTEEDAPILKSCEANQTEISVNSALKKTWLWHFRRSCRDDLNDISMYPFAQVRRKVDAILKENLLHGKGMILPGA